jgi:simple sugar transport system substrate-binding protein
MDIPVGTWDLYQVNLDGIQSGAVRFTVDQQPFLRGYIPVEDLVMNVRYGFVRSNWYLTGPSIVGQDEVDVVKQAVKDGIR